MKKIFLHIILCLFVTQQMGIAQVGDNKIKLYETVEQWKDGKYYKFIQVDIPVDKLDIGLMRGSNPNQLRSIGVKIYDSLHYVLALYSGNSKDDFSPSLDLYNASTPTYYSVLFHTDAFEKLKGKLHCEIFSFKSITEGQSVKTITFEYEIAASLKNKTEVSPFNGALIIKKTPPPKIRLYETVEELNEKHYKFIRMDIPVNENDIVNMRRSNVSSFPFVNVRIYDQLNYVNAFYTEEPYSYYSLPSDDYITAYYDYTLMYYSVLFHADAFEKFKGKLHCEISVGFSDFHEVKTITFEYDAVTPLDSNLLKLNAPPFNGAKIKGN